MCGKTNALDSYSSQFTDFHGTGRKNHARPYKFEHAEKSSRPDICETVSKLAELYDKVEFPCIPDSKNRVCAFGSSFSTYLRYKKKAKRYPKGYFS
jgi:hypothetical protein